MSREAAAVRAYRALVRLLPRPVRARDGEEMVATFAAMWAGASRTSERARCLWRSFGRLPMVALAEWYDHLGVGSRARRGDGLVRTVLQDVRYAARGLRKAPGFAAVTILTLALGIGATTAIFTVVNGVLLKPLPFEDPDELVSVLNTRASTTVRSLNESQYFTYRNENRVFEDVGFWNDNRQVSITGL